MKPLWKRTRCQAVSALVCKALALPRLVKRVFMVGSLVASGFQGGVCFARRVGPAVGVGVGSAGVGVGCEAGNRIGFAIGLGCWNVVDSD